MSLSKRHHFVPLMLSRRFVTPNGHLYAFNKNSASNGIFLVAPENLFVGKHLYSEMDEAGDKNDWLERRFSKIEGFASQVIEKIIEEVRQGMTPQLRVTEKRVWDLFFYYQWKRVPDYHSQIGLVSDFEESLEDFIREFERTHRPLTEEEKINLKNLQTQERIKQSAKVKALGDPGTAVQAVLSRKGLGIAYIRKPNKSFIIGSHPVVKLTYAGKTHLADPSVEAWLPIAPDIAVSPSPHRGKVSIHAISDEDVRRINEAIFRSSTMIASRSEALIKSLAGLR